MGAKSKRPSEGACPVCRSGELITISMSVNGSDLRFTTCHMCEAKWWLREDEEISLSSVIGEVARAGAKRSSS
jgi:hypothetical protein